MLQAFSERIGGKFGFDVTMIVSIATMIAEVIKGCQNTQGKLAAAIDDPTFLQRVGLQWRCRDEFGRKDGRRIADAILDEAKPFKAAALAGMAAGGEYAFENALLEEVAGL